jgi:hypothetical protein
VIRARRFELGTLDGREDAVLTDPGMTTDQARVLGDWVDGNDGNLTDTLGHNSAWFKDAEDLGPRV